MRGETVNTIRKPTQGAVSIARKPRRLADLSDADLNRLIADARATVAACRRELAALPGDD